MPTNDERREVADGLRRQVKRLGPQMDAHEFAHYGADVIDPDNELLRWDQMMLRLADLIEPEPERTCRMLLDEDATSLLEYDEVFRCTACGEEVVRKTGTTVRFCPMCGARVTDWVVPG